MYDVGATGEAPARPEGRLGDLLGSEPSNADAVLVLSFPSYRSKITA
jgi:hypothetical protein